MYCLPELSGEGEASEGRKAVGHGRGVDVDGHGVAQAEVQVATMIVVTGPGVNPDGGCHHCYWSLTVTLTTIVELLRR